MHFHSVIASQAPLHARVACVLVHDLLARARSAIAPGTAGPGWRCHTIVRALARVIAKIDRAPLVQVVDGGCYSLVPSGNWSAEAGGTLDTVCMSHSWLSAAGSIIDAAPPCAGCGPILVPPSRADSPSIFWPAYHAGEEHLSESSLAFIRSDDCSREVERVTAWIEPHAVAVDLVEIVREAALPVDVQPS